MQMWNVTTRKFTDTHTWKHKHTCNLTHTNTRTRANIHTHTHTHTHTYANTPQSRMRFKIFRTHTHTHTHTHTRTHSNPMQRSTSPLTHKRTPPVKQGCVYLCTSPHTDHTPTSPDACFLPERAPPALRPSPHLRRIKCVSPPLVSGRSGRSRAYTRSSRAYLARQMSPSGGRPVRPWYRVPNRRAPVSGGSFY